MPTLAAVLLLAAACGGPSDAPVAATPERRPDELASHDGAPCPRRLPLGEDPSGLGFGVEEPAVERPASLDVDRAWVCEYAPTDLGGREDRSSPAWRRSGGPERVAPDSLAALRSALDEVVPVDPERACTDELASRWMVVLESDGDLTGVVVDDYGCRDVRLTDEPHTTPPGAQEQAGTVAGVLDGGAAVLDAVGVGSR